MCGIVGLIKSGSLTIQDVAAVRRANSAMAHRGPDGSGEYCDMSDVESEPAHLFMAMRRLSIIDLAHGWQPLTNEDGTIAVVANGEIYNHIELRQELEGRGHRFRTNSDCEVLPHLYEEYGLDFVHKLRGMFAFALWDHRRRRIILGRDRMGEKPLYWHVTHDGIWFGSELKVLLATGRIPFAMDAAAIDIYLHYCWIPEPQTAVAGINKLRAGHLLIVDVDPWAYAERCYWRLEDAPSLQGNPVELVRAELDAIGRQIVRSDVPIGVALSSGFDSSLTAALAVKHNASQVHAFSVGYAGCPGQDERSLAARFAAELGMNFHSLELAPSDMTDQFPKLAFDRDDPIADIAGFGYFMLSKTARENGCPVLLQGQGGDELLWGYSWAKQAVLHSLRKFAGNPVGDIEALRAQLPTSWSRSQWVRFAFLIGGLAAGWRELSPGRRSARQRLVGYDLSDSFQLAANGAASTYTRQFRARLEAAGSPGPVDLLQNLADGCPIDIQVIALQCRGYLLENGLAQGDRLSMANSVELRLPLVDYRLVETLVGIQKNTPLYKDPPKRLLIEAARDLVPEYIVKRPKLGFNPPVSTWVAALRSKFGKDLIDGTLVENEVLDRRAAVKLANMSSRFGTAYDLFQKYLVLEFWSRGMQAVAQSARIDAGYDRWNSYGTVENGGLRSISR